MTPRDVDAAMGRGAVVLDMRLPRVFAREHVPGAINLQFNRADLVDRAEMVLPKDLPVVIHAEPEAVAKTAEELMRAAGFAVQGRLDGGLKAWAAEGLPTASIPVLTVDDLQRDLSGLQVVDAREPFEYRHGHVPGARLLPWTEAWVRAPQFEAERPIAVVCGDEVRSSLVASMLARAGRDARLVSGGMVDWNERALPVEKGA